MPAAANRWLRSDGPSASEPKRSLVRHSERSSLCEMCEDSTRPAVLEEAGALSRGITPQTGNSTGSGLFIRHQPRLSPKPKDEHARDEKERCNEQLSHGKCRSTR